MAIFTRRWLSGLAGGIAISALAAPLACHAAAPESSQQNNAADPDSAPDDIVVTGTLIRGIAPAGSNVVALSQQDIAATGATNTNEILANLPQNAAFNQLMQPNGTTAPVGGSSSITINRPSLRNLPGNTTSGSPLTLVLIDGHRVVMAGIGKVGVDPDIIPPGVLERVETITDGGSALYGSDAIGGVINFITRKRFDGARIEGHVGFADDYTTYDASAMLGKDWGSGSAYISYSYSHHGPIFGRDRDFVQRLDWATGIPTGRSCNLPNITTVNGSRSFALPGAALGTFNACDTSDDETFYQADTQHHIFGSIMQELGDSVTFEMKAFYSERHNLGNGGPFRSAVSVTNSNPNYINLPGSDAGLPQTVSFSYGPALGNGTSENRTNLRTWNITPSVTVRLGSDWQLRALIDYGKSYTEFANDTLFTARVNPAVLAGTLNPYNVAASSPSVLNSLIGTNIGRAWQDFLDFRAIADGKLLTLPGGDLRVAVGAEYQRTKYSQQTTNTADFTLTPVIAYNQSVTSVFGEAQIPVFGAENGFAGMTELSISASGRFDHYNDFGNTFNPKIGITYRPVDWIAITANWGKSFAAPTPPDQLGVLAAQSLVLSGTPSPYPNTATLNPALVPGQTTYSFVLLRGAVANLKPQKTVNWSIGTQIKPPFVPGLSLSASYYFINYADAIGSPFQTTDAQIFFRQFPDLVTVDPTAAQLAAFASQVNGGLANLATIPAGGRVVSMYDIRARNLGTYRLSGLDFAVNYKRETGFGSIDASFAGNYQLMLQNQVSPTAPVQDVLATDTPRLRFAASLGANIGKLRAQATLNHTSGFAVIRSATRLQDRVGAFNAVNLYFRYDVGDQGFGKDLSLSLNVNNLFDADPPVLRDSSTAGFSTMSGLTVGRLVQLGISKKF